VRRGEKLSTVCALALTMVAATAVAGCGSSDDGAAAGGSGPIKVGLSGALTGGDAILGQTQREGVQLALDELNADGGIAGRKIELVTEDEANDPSRMAQIAQKFVTQDKVTAILGGTNDGTAQVLAKVAESAEVPLVVPFANGDQITQGKKWSFQVDVASTAFVRAAMELMTEKYDKLGIAYDNNAFGQVDRDFALEDLKELGKASVADVSMPNEAGDYTAQLANLRKAGAEALFTPMSGTNVAQLRKDMIRTGYEPVIYGPNSLAFQSMIEIGGKLVEQSVRFHDVIDESKPEVGEFQSKFREKYGKDATSGFELLGYDAMLILAEGLKKGVTADAVDREKIRAGIEGLTDYTAVSGKAGSTISYSADEHRRPSPGDLALRWVKDGKFANAPAD
jgi:branched-chain amino acid transport system substrate-binding protein